MPEEAFWFLGVLCSSRTSLALQENFACRVARTTCNRYTAIWGRNPLSRVIQLLQSMEAGHIKSFTPLDIIDVLNSILDIDQHVTGIEYLKNLVRNMARTFEVKYVLVGRSPASHNDRIQTDVVWAGNDYSENFVYSLKGTPCENVLSGNRVCVYGNDVAESFPEDELLIKMGVTSYIGAPILTRGKKLSGLMALLDETPVENVGFYTAVVEFLAARVASELERYHLEGELRRKVAEKTFELEKTNKELHHALAEIRTLRGIIPICSYCKKIRDDKGAWDIVEAYISKHSDAQFSHGVCPDCLEKQLDDLA